MAPLHANSLFTVRLYKHQYPNSIERLLFITVANFHDLEFRLSNYMYHEQLEQNISYLIKIQV